MRYFLGADLGGTKTHVVIADETGQTVGFGEGGPGNHQGVGYEGTLSAMLTGLEQALAASGLTRADLAGAGFGIAGYDWPSQQPEMHATVARLGLSAPFHCVNDAVPGIVAGAEAGWGIGLVSGTGCNCWGLSPDHQRVGRVTGYGFLMGEAAGATELVIRAMQQVGYAWIKRIPPTALTQAFIEYAGASDVEALLEGYTEGQFEIDAKAAPLVFRVAAAGDACARQVIRWAGTELAEMALAVARQLEVESRAFEVVLAGSMFEGGPLLTDPLRAALLQSCPQARFVRLNAPPVVGAVLLGMKQVGLPNDPMVRARLCESIHAVKQAA